MDAVPDTARILTWIGIIEQLSRTAVERSLKSAGLSFAEFAMLNHFSHGRPPEKTVTGIAAAMQQLQPAVTKTVQKLAGKGLVKASASATDGRSKVLRMTPKGSAALTRGVASCAPLLGGAMADWAAADRAELFRLLDRLKVWLDDNR